MGAARARGRRPRVTLAREAAGLVADSILSTAARAVSALREGGPPPEPDPPGPPGAAPAQRAGVAVARRVVARPAHAAGELVADRIVPAILRIVDLNVIIDHIDVQRVVDRVDVDAVVKRVDVNQVLASVDVEDLVSRVDVPGVIERVDIGTVTREAMEGIDIGGLIRESTESIWSQTVDAGRAQAMRADDLVARGVDWILRRRGPRRTALDRPAASGS
jgi:hypothetical protein